MIRLGLMGVGVVASYGHIPAIERTPGIELKSIYEPDSARLIDAKAKYEVAEGFTDPDLFFRSGIDAVIITSPAPTHLANVLLAAKYKKPVLCEKPLAMNEEDSQRMIDAMQQAGMPLYVGFTYRFAQPAMDIKRLVGEGAIGRVLSLRLLYLWDCHGKYAKRGDPTRLSEARLGRMDEGGPMVDCGVHQIDLARWWLDSEVIAEQGLGAWVDEHKYPDHVWLHLDHASGAHTMVEISYSYAHTSADSRCEFVYELIGTDGMIRYDRQSRVFELVNKAGTQHLPWHEEKNFDGMYHELARALRTGKPGHMPTGQDGLAAIRLARIGTDQALARRVGK